MTRTAASSSVSEAHAAPFVAPCEAGKAGGEQGHAFAPVRRLRRSPSDLWTGIGPGTLLAAFVLAGLVLACGDIEPLFGSLPSEDATPGIDAGNDAADAAAPKDTWSEPPEHTVVALTSGGHHSCVRFADQSVKCWGANAAGQLGLGDAQVRGATPEGMGAALPALNLGTGRGAVAISAGGHHSCAVLVDHTVKCWGQNGQGQLGLGDTVPHGDAPGEMGDALLPVNLGRGETVLDVAAGHEHTCALLADHSVKCWGRNEWGELGIGASASRGGSPSDLGERLPKVALGTGRTAISIAAGDGHTCAILDDHSLKCWGRNAQGQLGIGDKVNRGISIDQMGDSLPRVDLGPGRTAIAVRAGQYTTCATLDDHSLKCWGYNIAGQLGQGNTAQKGDTAGSVASLPRIDLGQVPPMMADTSLFNACAILDSGAVKCWGANASGQLGTGDRRSHGLTPGDMGVNLPAVNLGRGRTAIAISSGGADAPEFQFNCALLDNRTVKCWGNNEFGTLGVGDAQNRGGATQDLGDALRAVPLW